MPADQPDSPAVRQPSASSISALLARAGHLRAQVHRAGRSRGVVCTAGFHAAAARPGPGVSVRHWGPPEHIPDPATLAAQLDGYAATLVAAGHAIDRRAQQLIVTAARPCAAAAAASPLDGGGR
jgi:hypothetical protein